MHGKHEGGGAAIVRQLAQHVGELNAREAAAAQFGRHREAEEAMLSERSDVGADIAVFRVTSAAFLGDLWAELGEVGRPIGGGGRAQGLNRHGCLLHWVGD
jgi:hypothetical protein